MTRKRLILFIFLLIPLNMVAQERSDYYRQLIEMYEKGDYLAYVKMFDKDKLENRIDNHVYIYHSLVYWVYLAEAYIACNDFDKAVHALTDKQRVLCKRMYIHGRWWTLYGDDLKKWSIEKKPLMDYLFCKIIPYYRSNYDLFKKSPLVNHIASLNRKGYNVKDLSLWAADEFYSSRDYIYDEKAAIYAANFGNIEAQKEVARKYLKGINVDCDTIKAFHYLTMAADQGDVYAANYLANSYLNGIGVSKNYNKAFKLFMKTAQMNDRTAKYGLGLCHYYGYGTPVNKTKAIEYLKDIEDWFIEVPYIIGIVFYEQNSEEAISYFYKALNRASLDNKLRGDILRKLSACYRFGRCGITEDRIDIPKADSLFNEAVKYGEEKAVDVMARFSAINQSFHKED